MVVVVVVAFAIAFARDRTLRPSRDADCHGTGQNANTSRFLSQIKLQFMNMYTINVRNTDS